MSDTPQRVGPQALRSPTEFLKRLAEGATQDELDSLHAEMRVSEVIAPGEVEQAYEMASRVRELLDAHSSQNEAQAALLESARQLGEVSTDIEPILQSIVTKARRLLGCDLSYLSLNDNESSDTYVRVMSGWQTDYWRDGRIPFGIGVGGRVAATAQPFATADYLNDARIEHDSYVDETVVGEGQVAIMASPLVHGGNVIGVLYAANRTPGAFPQASLDLLSAFAALAAVAIDRSQLFSEMQEAHRELSASNLALRAQTAEVERSIDAHDRSMDVILEGGGVQEVVAAAAQSLRGSLAIFDEDDVAIAWTPETSDDVLNGMAVAVQTERERHGRNEPVGKFWVAPLVAGNESLGSLVWAPQGHLDDVTEGDRRLLERTSVVASLLQLFRRNLGAAESKVRGELLDDLLRPTARTFETLAERAQRASFAVNQQHVVLALQVEAGRRPRLEVIAGEVAAERHGLSTVCDGLVIMALPAASASDTARKLSQSLTTRVGAPVTVGASEPVDDMTEIPRGFHESVGCVNALLRLGRLGEGACSFELGYVGLLIGSTSSAPDFVTRTLGPVIEHDKTRGTSLIETLRTYFDAGQSLAVSGARLHVHTNTVSQRLNRIKQLLGIDWSEPERALEVQLALRLHAMGMAARSALPDAERRR